MEPIFSSSPVLSGNSSPSRYPRGNKLLAFITGAILIISLIYTATTGNVITITNPFGPDSSPTPIATPDPDYLMPVKEEDRLDVLILGIRGENDPNASLGGPLLTDSIQVFSFNKKTKKSSIISLPRDLYVTITPEKKDKLNVVYEYGISHSDDSLNFVKEKVSQIAGVYVDQVVVFDFSSFKEIVDALGGIDVTLAQPFSESEQWGYKFTLPAGVNHLDGQNALYYARSRYSSNDFDRSRRQQQIMLAIKDKILQLNFFSDPVKSFSVINLIRSDVKTDIGVWNIKQYLDLANEVKFEDLKHTVISTENLLLESRENSSYVLLPKAGNFSSIKQFFQDSIK